MTQKAKKTSAGKYFTCFLLMIATAVIITINHDHRWEREAQDKPFIMSSLRTSASISTDSLLAISPDRLNSPNAILLRLSDNTKLLQKNSDDIIHPASLTKMMTVLVAIENLSDLKKEIELTASSFQELYKAGASMAGFEPGERVQAMDLLYGAMLPSGAECCIGLAVYIASSEQEFVKLMNKKAAELAMDHTHFENTTGLTNDNHYTTVSDLALLLRYALQNNIFREIFTTSTYTTNPTNIHPDGLTLYSTMFHKISKQSILDGEILGGKTGYTDAAGLCLASLAKVGDEEYILISAGAKGNHHTKQYNIIDAITVYNSILKS